MRRKATCFVALEHDCFCSADAEDSRDDRATADVVVNAYSKLTSDIETNTGGPSPSRPSIGYGGEYGNYTDPETGLLCLGHRYYNPGTGRFLNRDLIGYSGGINLYGYAGNNPVNGVDPEGTDALDDASNFSAGMGDILSFGATSWFRQEIGVDDIANKHSGAYVVGEVAGVAVSAVDTGAGVVGVARPSDWRGSDSDGQHRCEDCSDWCKNGRSGVG